MDIDYYTGDVRRGMPGAQKGPVPIVRAYGVTQKGHSVLAHIHGFTPYFWVAAPPGLREEHLNQFRLEVNDEVKSRVRKDMECSEYVLTVELHTKQSIYKYQGDKMAPFLKVYVALPGHVPTTRGVFEKGFKSQFVGHREYATFESNVPYALRLMIDLDIVGGNWIEVQPSKYTIRSPSEHTSRCQLEIDVSFTDVVSHAAEGDWSHLAPLRVLSFDIECCGRKGHFPEPEHDSVIQIANLVTEQGKDKPFVSNVFVLGTCTPIVGTQVIEFEREADLLRGWKDFVQEVDPDIVIGYNIANFDLPYLVNRAATLNVQDFPFLGRSLRTKSVVKTNTFSSKAYGTRETQSTSMDGRVQLDILAVIQRDYKLSSYTLNAVSAHFLNEQKEDVHHSIIGDLHNGSAEDRRRLAVYCLKDAYLPQRLLEKLMVLFNYVEMARVTGVPLSFLLERGQQIKVMSQLLRFCKDQRLLIPNLKREAGGNETYEGATVIEPKRGFYDVPVVTLDFASLYPSIMMAHNLCYTTLLQPGQAEGLSKDDYVATPLGPCFVKASVRKGILPQILENLLAARSRAKADLKKATDPLRRAVLDGRQLALKISANSVYGFTGATVGQLPMLEISSAVTAFGRQMIELTKSLVETTYNVEKGFEHDVDVVYGDTDSVMIRFPDKNLEKAMEFGKVAADFVSSHFDKPIKLEFEKVYFPYLLINKKRYAGLYWTRPDKYDKMDTKGIETVRRDNCGLVRNVISTCLNKILIDQDVNGAVDYAKGIISDLLTNKVDLSLLVITKALSKDADGYANKQAHVELAARMRKRDPATAPNMGDRVPYVMIKGAKGAKAYEKAEDPIYVLDNNIPIDPQYYLDSQLSKPLLRIFDPILPNPQSLLVGDHTRSITVVTPTSATSGIMRFAVKTLTCLGCKVPIQSGTLCKHCTSRDAELFYSYAMKVKEHEENFSRVWTQCQRCQGSFYQEVLCTSGDCPIYYNRVKCQKDLKDATDVLNRFKAAAASW